MKVLMKFRNFSDVSDISLKKFTFKFIAHESVIFLDPLLEPIRKNVFEFLNEVHFAFHLNRNPNPYQILYPLNELNFTFPNVKFARVDYCIMNATTLYQMFPAVRSLELEKSGMSVHLPHLPHLQRLTIPGPWAFADPSIVLPLFEPTLELNPQLRHISITFCNHWKLVEALNEIRPYI